MSIPPELVKRYALAGSVRLLRAIVHENTAGPDDIVSLTNALIGLHPDSTFYTKWARAKEALNDVLLALDIAFPESDEILADPGGVWRAMAEEIRTIQADANILVRDTETRHHGTTSETLCIRRLLAILGTPYIDRVHKSG